MAVVRVQPDGFEIEVRPGETLMTAAVRAGYYWPTTCGGQGTCTTCATEIISGDEVTVPAGRAEQRALVEGRGSRAVDAGIRLACQLQITGGAVVRKAGVRPPGS